MKVNIGSIDKTFRLVLGVLIAIWGIYFQNWLGLIALVPLGTALINFCPLYAIVGIDTCSVKTNK